MLFLVMPVIAIFMVLSNMLPLLNIEFNNVEGEPYESFKTTLTENGSTLQGRKRYLW